MKKTRFVWMILLMVILLGCYASESVPLTLPATAYEGNQLRIDGYFSEVIPQDAEDIKAGRDTFFKNFFYMKREYIVMGMLVLVVGKPWRRNLQILFIFTQ